MGISLEIITHESSNGQSWAIEPRLRVSITTPSSDPYSPYSDTDYADILLSELRDALALVAKEDSDNG